MRLLMMKNTIRGIFRTKWLGMVNINTSVQDYKHHKKDKIIWIDINIWEDWVIKDKSIIFEKEVTNTENWCEWRVQLLNGIFPHPTLNSLMNHGKYIVSPINEHDIELFRTEGTEQHDIREIYD